MNCRGIVGGMFTSFSSSVSGLQTALRISPDQSWSVSGTSSGKLICWDLRFHLPVVKFYHPSEARIRDLAIKAGNNTSQVLVAVQVRINIR